MLAGTCFSIIQVGGGRVKGRSCQDWISLRSGGTDRPRFSPFFSLLLYTFAAPLSTGKHIPSCKTWFVLLPLYLLGGSLCSQCNPESNPAGVTASRWPPLRAHCPPASDTTGLPAPLRVPALADILPPPPRGENSSTCAACSPLLLGAVRDTPLRRCFPGSRMFSTAVLEFPLNSLE